MFSVDGTLVRASSVKRGFTVHSRCHFECMVKLADTIISVKISAMNYNENTI